MSSGLDGKLAHVVHHYNNAVRLASDRAAARFAGREASYYARLNSDDDYLALELRRIDWLQNLHRARRIAARIALASLGLVIVGASIDDSIRAVGWSLAISAVICWLSVAIANRFFTHRRTTHTAER